MVRIDISKKLFSFDGERELKIKLDIKEGEFLSLSGKSGAGKTTLLRILAGLENSSGSIFVNNQVWQKDNFFLSPQKRNIGFVFQDYALFPNMSVEENLYFALSKGENREIVEEMLEITELQNLRKRFPHQLSGGQKQRVALSRAMVRKPKILLLDEPLSALDFDMREKLQDEVLEIHKRFKTTTILVSHDKSEIEKLSDRVFNISS